MRITGGTLKNRQVQCPKGIIRPAMDRMRESLFAILGDLGGKSFLDLFTGSGMCGLEAYSRGAYPVVLVEKDKDKFPILLKNAALFSVLKILLILSTLILLSHINSIMSYCIRSPKNRFWLLEGLRWFIDLKKKSCPIKFSH